ncbi:MAG: MerR family transcriptional regulator [Candidatus Caenarcaniphilales bacterium]|nr:MerR family transcriptional regulator [Candidatus Caenarcaniphilales bacterium]
MSELNNMEEQTGSTIQEASKTLSIPENTLRKYLTYFDIAVEKQGRKTLLTNNSMNCLSEIVQLKGNGWSLKEIKNFRDKQGTNSEAKEKLENKEIVSVEEQTEEPIIAEEINEASFENNDQVSINEVEDKNILVQTIEHPRVIPSLLEENLEVDTQSEPSILSFARERGEEKHDKNEINANNLNEELEIQIDENEDVNSKIKLLASKVRLPLTKDLVNKEIAVQAKRASRLYRFLSSRNAPRDSAEIKADLDRRVVFLNGLRYLRDNWLERKSADPHEDKLAKV